MTSPDCSTGTTPYHVERELLWVDGGPAADRTVAAARTTNLPTTRYTVFVREGDGPWFLRASGTNPSVAEERAPCPTCPNTPVLPTVAAWLDGAVEELLREVGAWPQHNDRPELSASATTGRIHAGGAR